MKFENWAEEWLLYKENYVKESTYANYLIAMVNHIIPAFSGMEVNEITTKKIQNIALMWSETGKKNGAGGLAIKTIKDMVIILKMCLRDYEEYYDSKMKIKKIEYPLCNKSKVGNKNRVLTREQQTFMINAVKRDLDCESLGYATSLYTGMRIGELCALKWENIDMKNRTIKVEKTLQRIYFKSNEKKGKTKVVITSPKSDKSVRTIPISKTLFELLEILQCRNEKSYLLTGNTNYLEPRLYRKHYENFLQKHELEHINFHGLRHTFATRCIEKGADYKVVSELLGHSSVNITLNLYVHPNLETKRQCVELI